MDASAKPRKMCPKLIIEGTRLTWKTELAFTLNEHPRVVGPRRYRYHSPLISAEWCALTNVPWGRGLVNFETPDEEARALETYHAWLRILELQKYYSWIIDRFHVSTRVHQRQTFGRDYDFTWLEDQLLPLGFRIIFCTRRPDTFASARQRRLKVSGNPAQYDDLQVFVAEQEEFRRVLAESCLPILELDMSNDDVAGAADRVANWLEQTGGLYLD